MKIMRSANLNMNHRYLETYPLAATAALLLGSLLFSTPAAASLRCDCSQIVAACSAEVGLDDGALDIQSSADACSRVDYLIDGQPYAALVVDGEAQFKWQGQPQTAPQIVVENCRVCADSKLNNVPAAEPAAAASTATDAEESDGELRALIKVMPTYPRAAWGRGIEGRVTVEFTLADDGVVQNIRVLDSSNAAFVTATMDAVSRFKYSAGSAEPVQEEFSFRLLNGSDPVVSSRTL